MELRMELIIKKRGTALCLPSVNDTSLLFRTFPLLLAQAVKHAQQVPETLNGHHKGDESKGKA
jgi:hypothetical protein